MSRFTNVSDKIYVGYEPGDLNYYGTDAITNSYCIGNIDLYNNINNEFNPNIVHTLKQREKINKSKPFFGQNGLSLKFDMSNNLILKNNSTEIWRTGCNSGSFNNKIFTFNTTVFGCSGNIIVDRTFNGTDKIGNILSRPYCQLDTSGNLVCYGCTTTSGIQIPYMTLINDQNPSYYNNELNLIIDGSFALPTHVGSGNSMLGNLTIIAGNNMIVKSTINNTDYTYLRDLNKIFGNSIICNNANDALSLSNDYFSHLAAVQLNNDMKISHSYHYINAINLGIGIIFTMGYIYILSKKK